MHAIKASAVEFLHSYHNLSTNIKFTTILLFYTRLIWRIFNIFIGGVREHPRTFAHLLIFNKMIMKAVGKKKYVLEVGSLNYILR